MILKSENEKYIESLIDGAKTGKFKTCKTADEFEFSCERCGMCCKNRDDVVVSSFDLFRVAKALDTTPLDFVKKYCNQHIGHSSKAPILTIAYRKRDGYTACPFFKNDKGLYACRIHDARPAVCINYSLGRFSSVDEHGKWTTEYILQDVDCIGARIAKQRNVMQSVSDWLGGDDYIKANIKHNEKLYNILDEVKANINRELPPIEMGGFLSEW